MYITWQHYTEYSIYCGFINTMGLYIRLSYFHPFQQFFIHIDKFYPFFIHSSSNLPILNNVEKIVWPTVYAVLGVASSSSEVHYELGLRVHELLLMAF
jgi:hypothetical protein